MLSILIVGAGASGLACALTFAASGVKVRVIEKRANRSTIGKATGIAQGVWTQLHNMGINNILADAEPMQNFVFYDDEQPIAYLKVPLVNQQPPAKMYPQALLEQELEIALKAFDIEVEYGVELFSFTQAQDSIKAQLTTGVTTASWMIAADGAHSLIRKQLAIPFIGKDYPEQWSVAQIQTPDWDENTQAKLYLQSNGIGLFLSHPRPHLVQGILNAPNAASHLFGHFPNAILEYERHFKVSLRRVETPRAGRVWLIGDAAHTQSPVGGQGLNLAIWDGITLAQGLLNNDLSVEKKLAKRAKRTLFFTHFDYYMLANNNYLIQGLRNLYWRIAVRYPIISRWFFKLISGVE